MVRLFHQSANVGLPFIRHFDERVGGVRIGGGDGEPAAKFDPSPYAPQQLRLFHAMPFNAGFMVYPGWCKRSSGAEVSERDFLTLIVEQLATVGGLQRFDDV